MDAQKGSTCIMDNFYDRQKHLNEQLNEVEKSLNKHNNHKDSLVPKLEDLSNSCGNRNKIRGFKGRQSIFKRPEGPAPRANIQTIPDYRRNPSKWTYYSLEDVPEMTAESNSQAAFAFLNELRQRRKREARERKIKERLNREDSMEIGTNESIMEEDDDNLEEEESVDINDESKSSISFKKPKQKEACIEKAKPEFRGNKVIMPEYEIGTKKVSIKKRSQKCTPEEIYNKKVMKLDHLELYEDEEE